MHVCEKENYGGLMVLVESLIQAWVTRMRTSYFEGDQKLLTCPEYWIVPHPVDIVMP